MKFKLKRQPINHPNQGLAGLELLLVLAALLLVAGSGLIIYHQQQPMPTAKQAASHTSTTTGISTSPGGIPGGASQASGSSSSSAPATSTPSLSGQIVFKIPAAGLQLSLPNSLSDLTYHLTSGNPLRLSFSTKSLSAAVPSCAADQNIGAFDIILRGNGNYQPPANASSGGLLKQYGSYYFAYLLPTGPCAKGLSSANQKLLDDQAQAFYNALPSAKAL
jgi:hypothetical protein